MKHLTFKKATIAPRLINGVLVDFSFTITQDGNKYEKDSQLDHVFRIGFSTYLLIGWGEDINSISDNQVIKMAFPFAENLIIEKINDGTLKDFDERIYTIEDNLQQFPFDLNKVNTIEGKTIEIKESQSTIGEIIATNPLADEIVQLRDNINTLFHDKYKEKLLLLNEERGILNFFRVVKTEEEFTHRLASLGELIKNMNSEKLKSLVKKHAQKDGSILLLEKFIEQVGIKDFKLIEIFRNIIRIRQGFPTHTDKAGIISSLAYFGLNYPINDFSKAWKILIINYRDALKELRAIMGPA